MLQLFIPQFSWDWGIIGAVIMFGVFIALVVALLLLMRGGKKAKSDS